MTMKKLLIRILLLLPVVFLNAQITTTPSTFEATSPVTINFDKTGTALATYTGTIYAHIGVTVNGVDWQNVKGTWGNNTTQPALTLVSGNVYKLDIAPSLYSYFGVATTNSITRINVVFRNAAGNLQNNQGTFINVGAFQGTLTAPVANSTTVLNSGQNFTVSASNTGGSANYNLLANGTSINTNTGSTYSFTNTSVTVNTFYQLTITMGTVSFSYNFLALVNPITQNTAMASGLEDGINYNTTDPTKATLVLTAPGKDFVYVAGSFNNWQPGTDYAMKKDPTSGKFWLELNNLTSGTINTFQYWVVDQTPTTNSPTLVKVADPFSTLILSPYDDQWVPAASYPNMPVYPAGQQYEVSVLQTGQATYNWSNATTGFVKPKKDNLVVYEVLIRDFDAARNFQTLINRMDYFKNLKINAIELMPVMEYEGGEGWGYNPVFHLALDKYYGTKEKFKELIDLCHQNGIAVILDVALNHAFGRSPLVRMWMNDPSNSGYGAPATDNPYFNTVAKHSYGVGDDFNHSSAYTKYYTKRVIKQWVEEFKIDGFRWDLTKGFTQACSSGDDTCTNAYQQDRVDILKEYADYSWSLDPNHYVIFEHLGIDAEEQQWANYRIAETPSKGVMMWGELYDSYKQLMMGYSTNADITRMGNTSRGFSAKRLMGYPESHDKDRMMYQAMTYGVSTGGSPVSGNLTNSLYRMSALGATSLLVPGPKMIWHFADLGMNDSIFTCTNGTVNTDTDATAGDCKLATKPQPQWTNNWLTDPLRSQIYSNWSKMIDLKKNNTVFNGSYAISPNGSNLKPRIFIWDDSLPTTQLKNVVVLANFGTDTTTVTPDFPYTGTWVNLMDNSTLNVTSTTSGITIEAGGFRVYGNNPAVLSNDAFEMENSFAIYPNPSSTYFSLNRNANQVAVYTLTGQLVKSFEQSHTMDYQYSISDLSKGLYIVKITDFNSNERTVKLIKE